MELTEPIESINRQLVDLFGIDTITNKAMFRVVWSEDQFEKRKTEYTDSGIKLLEPEVRELPKYRQWIHNKYVLERLVAVPEVNKNEIFDKISYEPLWVFEDSRGNALPPTVWACKFCIDTVHAAIGKAGLRKYVDEEAENPIESREKRINKLEEELFGDESSLKGTTFDSGSSIIVPQSYDRNGGK